MTDDKEKNKPDTPPVDTGDETEKQPLRKISDEVLQANLANHKKWLESGQKEGSRADLSYVDLSQNHWEITTVELDRPGSVLDQGPNLNRAILVGAKLSGVNLPGVLLNHANIAGADFSDCLLKRAKFEDANAIGAQFQNSDMTGAWLAATNLSHANLDGAKLSGGYLEHANLFGANVRQADFEKADMQHATLGTMGFSEANLQDCNFKGATGLRGTEFARADITGAKLPEDIREFKSLKVVEEISKNARKIFLAMLLGCAYALLTIATSTDAKLILNSVSSPLPIIGAEIRIAYFYYAAPFLLLGLYLYLHLYLQRLWEALAKLPARFVDGKSLDERAYPWLLNGLVRRHFDRLKDERSGIQKLEELVSISLAWWVVPLTLGAFWYWYLVRHHWPGTYLHIVLIVLSIAGAILFHRSHARTLRGTERTAFPWLRFYRDRRTYQTVAPAVIAVALVIGSIGAIEGLVFLDANGFKPCWTKADLREAQLSIKPPNYWSLDSAVRNSAVIGANLKGADLRHAEIIGAFLVNADLRRVDLRHSMLGLADLAGADLFAAHLETANLGYANLSGTRLMLASLTDALLWGAILIGADLRGADLSSAIGLTQAQLDQACGDTRTKLPQGLTIKQCPEK
jgi:uncharacterized protein YjbI with pentapeptide repeats